MASGFMMGNIRCLLKCQAAFFVHTIRDTIMEVRSRRRGDEAVLSRWYLTQAEITLLSGRFWLSQHQF